MLIMLSLVNDNFQYLFDYMKNCISNRGIFRFIQEWSYREMLTDEIKYVLNSIDMIRCLLFLLKFFVSTSKRNSI